MKEIPLTQGLVALVDDEDFEELTKYKWHAYRNGINWYAKRNSRNVITNARCTIRMHRVIMVGYFGSLPIDHIDGYGLNNQKSNLRLATTRQNCQNQKPKGSTSQYKGVSWSKDRKKWTSKIRTVVGRIYVGQFTNEVDAAIAYDKKAKELHGEYAYLNFPEGVSSNG